MGDVNEKWTRQFQIPYNVHYSHVTFCCVHSIQQSLISSPLNRQATLKSYKRKKKKKTNSNELRRSLQKQVVGHTIWLETFSIRQTAISNRSLRLRVCSFAFPRFQTLARRSVQFIFISPKYNTIQEYI